MAKLVKDVVDLIDIKAKDKGLSLIVNARQDLPSVLYGDENRIRQVIVNILNNAVKYTREGSVELQVCANKTKEDSVELEVVVKDTGIGIKQEDIGCLFESFSRVDEKNNKNIEGTGLGLAITHRLIEMMQGYIYVESEYGKGTTFKIVLPQRLIDDAPMGDFMQAREERKEREHIDASNLNVLIVDDNRINLAVARGLLKPTKAAVTTCLSGGECLELMKNNHFDLVLMDHMMPEMDGVETMKKAKEDSEIDTDGVCFIVLTANAISGIRDKYIEDGFDDYLSKPIDSKEMEDMISKYCMS